jgi:flagellar M-ring protein FliF
MENFFQNIKAFYDRLSPNQRIGIGLVVVCVLASLIAVGYWAQQTEYALLFGNLSETAASEVVEVLGSENIDYQLKEGGTTIYVPHDQVYDLRLRFAGEGIVSDGSSGYEIFDQNTLGMTDFMQKLNLKRALEGELERTISNISQIEAARVHLVMPERSPFRETQTTTTASVVVDLKTGARLSQEHIAGMIALVAGAVEGLEPPDVNILDTNGNMLSEPDADDTDGRLSSSQLRLQTEKESYLQEKAQSLLAQMLGQGNAIIRVNLELDFSRSVTESSMIDPESQTVIAEERLQEEGDIDNASSSVRNYEVSRSVETVEKSVGDISYLSVSVILNYKALQPEGAAEGDAAPSYSPYPEDEIANIESLVKESVGWREDRGDGFAISQLMFDTSANDQITQELREQQEREQTEMYIRYGLMVLALVLAAWLIRNASKRAKETVEALQPGRVDPQLTIRSDRRPEESPRLSAGRSRPADIEEDEDDLILIDDIYTSKLSPEAKARLKAKQKMLDQIRQGILNDPQESANLLRSWLAADSLKEEPAEAAA